uniref:Uncharacterized protein n=1 Tax=Anguilla anguilla TaxID=7936 RepID=A0A0E9X1L1_ANGAN
MFSLNSLMLRVRRGHIQSTRHKLLWENLFKNKMHLCRNITSLHVQSANAMSATNIIH